MKRLKLLRVSFDLELDRREIPLFRAAIIERVGREHTLFHNHTESGFLYKYPLIQYKTIGRQPSIMCIDNGVEEIAAFFSAPKGGIRLGQREVELKLSKLSVNQFNLQVWQHKFRYSLKNWLALNSNNYNSYQKIEGISEKVAFLEKILKANILSFAKGVGWTIDKPVECVITNLAEAYSASFKKNKLTSFTIEFNTNVFLPNYIGLGKGVSHGFGTVKQLPIDPVKKIQKAQ